jgi:hypothetical protein
MITVYDEDWYHYFFIKEFEVVTRPGSIDPRFVLACALLALMAEARREDRN